MKDFGAGHNLQKFWSSATRNLKVIQKATHAPLCVLITLFNQTKDISPHFKTEKWFYAFVFQVGLS